MNFLARLLATVGYVGYVPLAPGTAGSLLALPLPWLVLPRLSLLAIVGIMVATLAIAVWSANREANEGQKDPPQVVVDEFAGQIVALLFVRPTMFSVVAGFILFRLFDVYKPFPSRQAEKLPGGWGIVMDDVVAGIYANLVLQMFIHVFRR